MLVDEPPVVAWLLLFTASCSQASSDQPILIPDHTLFANTSPTAPFAIPFPCKLAPHEIVQTGTTHLTRRPVPSLPVRLIRNGSTAGRCVLRIMATRSDARLVWLPSAKMHRGVTCTTRYANGLSHILLCTLLRVVPLDLFSVHGQTFDRSSTDYNQIII